MTTILTFILIILSMIRTTLSACSMPSQQYDFLHTLYTSTNGRGWSSACNNWMFSETDANFSAPCQGWYGIAFNSLCDVTQLNMSSCNLKGTIPSQLMSMTSIIYLHLDYNNLSGTIPSQLTSLTNMTHFMLSNNSLTGTIPSLLVSMASFHDNASCCTSLSAIC